MKQEIVVRGMTCGHCIARVSSVFESNTGINQYELSLETGRATLWSNEPIDLQSLQTSLSTVGNYQIELTHEKS